MHSHPPRRYGVISLVVVAVCCLSAASLKAQWQTENYSLKAGWNAIWLPLDVSYATMEEIVPASVDEVWRWNANVAGTFNSVPNQTDLQWSVWRRGDPAGTNFGLMDPNYAYLIRVTTGTSTFVWSVKGKPVTPSYDWTSTGVNLVGFPMETPGSSSLRNLTRFYNYDPVLKQLPTTLYYNGGELSSVAPKNPLAIGNPNSYQVLRYQAYWVQATSFTEYYGPLKIETSSAQGLRFGSETVSLSVRVKNVAVNSTNTQSVNVVMSPLGSEAAPAGETPAEGPVPLRLRGDLDLNTGLYAYENVTGPIIRTLSPGEEKEFIFTVDRSSLSNEAGKTYESLLSITDSLNLTRVVLPVTAESTSRSGLWVGAAVMNQVDFVEGNTSTEQEAPATFPLRLILHSTSSDSVRLLQQAYTGLQSGEDVVSDKEDGFTAPAKASARLSSAHFPKHLNTIGTGVLGLSGSLTFSVPLSFTASDNPFVHSYHPDHDNMDERFTAQLPAGRESNDILRSITLTFESSNPSGFDPAWGSTSLGGTYTETITGLRAVPLVSTGRFLIQRASQAASFVTAP